MLFTFAIVFRALLEFVSPEVGLEPHLLFSRSSLLSYSGMSLCKVFRLLLYTNPSVAISLYTKSFMKECPALPT